MSNSDHRKCPEGIYPEYAFTGRSNVGKSSLINFLCGRKSLAKTSSTPGKTQLINHFLINKNWFLADLPGYGYAKHSKTEREKWTHLIHNYLIHRPNLMCVFQLIDSRHDPQKNDMDFMQWMGQKGIPFVIVFTKADKLKPAKLHANLENYEREMLKVWEVMPDYYVTSSFSKKGSEEILEFIEETNSVFRK